MADQDIACRDCQLSGDPRTKGAYNLFECRDCRVRYAIDCMERLSPNKDEAERTKDALFDALLKWRECDLPGMLEA